MRTPSLQTRQVFQALLDSDDHESYGFELVKHTGLRSGSVYPILRRLEDEGLVTAREEVINPDARRPRHRVYYQLTLEGRAAARQAIRNRSDMLRSLSAGWGG